MTDRPMTAHVERPARLIPNILWPLLLACPALADPVLDDTGEAFPVARCVNLGAALEAPSEGEWGYRVRRADLGRIARAGFDAVRLPVRWDVHWDGERIDPAHIARVDAVIGWARAEGLVAVLDLHHFWPLTEDPDAHAPTFLAIWDALARHHAGAPDDLVLELLNEPEGALTTAKAHGLQQQALARIRPLHPDRWIVTGGGDWNDLDAMLALPPPGPREARTFHYYAPWSFTHQGAPYVDETPPPRAWDPAWAATIRDDMRRAGAAPYPVLLGEFGTYDAVPRPDAAAWTAAVREAAEAAGLPWCHWGFTQGAQEGFQLYDTQREAWREDVLRALIPGTP